MSQPGADKVDAPLAEKLLQLVSGGWMSQALYVAAELRIAELLADGPKAVDELAAASGADAGALRRLLRALTTIDVCRQDAQGRFEITRLGSLLRADVPNSLRACTIWWGKYLWPIWGRLLYSVQTGRSARQQALGTEGFEHLQQDSEAAQIFHTAAAEMTRLNAAAMADAYDFSRFARLRPASLRPTGNPASQPVVRYQTSRASMQLPFFARGLYKSPCPVPMLNSPHIWSSEMRRP